eukprot:Hpha_TRINITY_DN15862_c1_g5::TRINITY_DN15862_c1_g5_i2::g.191787::m.191787
MLPVRALQSRGSITSESPSPSRPGVVPLGALCGAFPMDEDQFARLQKHFHEVDRDEDAALDRGELQDLWRIIFPNMPTCEIRAITDDIFKDLDPNKDGEVSFGELRDYILHEATTDVDRLLEDAAPRAGPNTWRETLKAVVDPEGPRYLSAPRWLVPLRLCFLSLSQGLIVLSCIAMILESLPSNQRQDQEPGSTATFVIETVCVTFFTLEIIIRFIAAESCEEWACSFFTWVDILAVVPYFFSLIVPENPTGPFLVLRVVRLLRILKLGRQFLAVQLMVIALSRCIEPLLVLMVGVNIITITLLGSSIYTVELAQASFNFTDQTWYRDVDSHLNDAGKKLYFQSIPDGMWWALVTMTTVGYGDSFPLTPVGKTIGSVTMIIGLILLAFPLTLISSSFQDVSKELTDKRLMHERRRTFRIQIARQSALGLQKPMSLMETEDFSVDMPVVHETRGRGVCVAARESSVDILYEGQSNGFCCGPHRYSAQSLLCGKLKAVWGVGDFPVGKKVHHEGRGLGTVVAADSRVHIRFDSGEQHSYRQTSIAKAKLKPLDLPLEPPEEQVVAVEGIEDSPANPAQETMGGRQERWEGAPGRTPGAETAGEMATNSGLARNRGGSQDKDMGDSMLLSAGGSRDSRSPRLEVSCLNPPRPGTIAAVEQRLDQLAVSTNKQLELLNQRVEMLCRALDRNITPNSGLYNSGWGMSPMAPNLSLPSHARGGMIHSPNVGAADTGANVNSGYPRQKTIDEDAGAMGPDDDESHQTEEAAPPSNVTPQQQRLPLLGRTDGLSAGAHSRSTEPFFS